MKNLLLPLVTTALLPSALLGASSAFQSAVVGSNPYGYYQFGESSGTTAGDASGNSRNGTYLNAPTLGVAGAGSGSDTAATFNGSTQSTSVGALAGFGSLLGTSTFEFVFSTTTASQMELAGVLNTGSTTAFEVSLNRNAAGSLSANGVRLFLRDQNNNAVGASFSLASAFDGGFHHLVFTYNSAGAANSDRIKAYLDGAEQTLTFGGFGGNQTPQNFVDFGFDPSIAARQNRATTDLFFNGTLDEVAFYTATLSAGNVAAHYAALIPEPAGAAICTMAGCVWLLFRRNQRRQ